MVGFPERVNVVAPVLRTVYVLIMVPEEVETDSKSVSFVVEVAVVPFIIDVEFPCTSIS